MYYLHEKSNQLCASWAENTKQREMYLHVPTNRLHVSTISLHVSSISLHFLFLVKTTRLDPFLVKTTRLGQSTSQPFYSNNYTSRSLFSKNYTSRPNYTSLPSLVTRPGYFLVVAAVLHGVAGLVFNGEITAKTDGLCNVVRIEYRNLRFAWCNVDNKNILMWTSA